MKQFLLPHRIGSEPFRLGGKDYHYLRNVLRLTAGDTFLGRDQEGGLYRLTVVAEAVDALIVKSKERLEEDRFAYSIVLFQCLPKGRTMDRIVRQATEMGVHGIVPLESEFTELRLEGKVIRKTERWRRIAREALQQSGASKMPFIAEPGSIDDLAQVEGNRLRLVFHSGDSPAVTLAEALESAPENIEIVIGPEGGLSPGEIDRLLEKGSSVISLGETILRVDTAAVAALAAVKNVLREKRR